VEVSILFLLAFRHGLAFAAKAAVLTVASLFSVIAFDVTFRGWHEAA